MSVRRLADAAVQPAAFAFSGDNQRWAERKIAEYPPGRQQSAVIPLLMRAQEQEGWVSRAAIEAVGQMLDMAYIRVLEVATFYTQFQLGPVGTRAHIQVCGTTPCMLRGAEDIRAVCERKIHAAPHHTNADGTMSWEEVECLGACVNAPMVMIGKDTYEDLTVERFEQIVDAFAAGNGASIKPGPQVERQFSEPQGGATTLTEEPTAERTYQPFPPPEPAPAAAAPAAAPAEPTKPGRKDGEVPEEAAPAIKGPPGARKVSADKAEAELDKAEAEAGGGEPDKAMRPDATGAEAEGGKRDTGASAAPRKLFEAPEGNPDDLKLISGIGPVLERTLNAIGITRWSQVADLTADQIAEVEGEIGMRGRAERDNWRGQAQVLARGGVEEYRRVFGKEPR